MLFTIDLYNYFLLSSSIIFIWTEDSIILADLSDDCAITEKVSTFSSLSSITISMLRHIVDEDRSPNVSAAVAGMKSSGSI